jgi:hypothetical protein
MNIRYRLYLLTVLNVFVCLTIGLVGYAGIERLHPVRINNDMYAETIEALDSVAALQEAMRADVLLALSSDRVGETLTTARANIQQHARNLTNAFGRITSAPLPADVARTIADSKYYSERLASLASAIPEQGTKNPDTLTTAAQSVLEAYPLLQASTAKSKAQTRTLWHADRARATAFAHAVQNMVMTTLLLGVACIIVLVLITIRSIIRPIGEVIEALGVSAVAVDSSAQKMSLYAEDLAQSAMKQAAAVQESVASMTEMSSMIAQTSDSTTESLSNVRRMAERTQDGNRIMERLASSSEAINQADTQLREMVDIIAEISAKTSVINDIVFKTQLLSFNASIEAARAGQHGRGFAVVAEEFGSLAEVSGKAAKEIQALLETSKKHVAEVVEMTHQRVTDGLTVSKEALSIFHEISRDINEVTKQIQRIAEATREQAVGVQQTSTAMNQMDQAAQLNSLLAGDSLRSASDLARQSHKLTNIMRGLLSLISHSTKEPVATVSTPLPNAPKHTRILEFNDADSSLDSAFLHEAATKLSHRTRAQGTEAISADDEDFRPYNGSSQR